MTLFRDRYSIIHSIFLQDEISIQLPQDKRNLHPDLFMSHLVINRGEIEIWEKFGCHIYYPGMFGCNFKLICCGFLIFLSDRDFDNPQD